MGRPRDLFGVGTDLEMDGKTFYPINVRIGTEPQTPYFDLSIGEGARGSSWGHYYLLVSVRGPGRKLGPEVDLPGFVWSVGGLFRPPQQRGDVSFWSLRLGGRVSVCRLFTTIGLNLSEVMGFREQTLE